MGIADAGCGREEVQDGYRDVQLSVIFSGELGLRIIGEIQVGNCSQYTISAAYKWNICLFASQSQLV